MHAATREVQIFSYLGATTVGSHDGHGSAWESFGVAVVGAWKLDEVGGQILGQGHVSQGHVTSRDPVSCEPVSPMLPVGCICPAS
jgi:hypothetical protein